MVAVPAPELGVLGSCLDGDSAVDTELSFFAFLGDAFADVGGPGGVNVAAFELAARASLEAALDYFPNESAAMALLALVLLLGHRHLYKLPLGDLLSLLLQSFPPLGLQVVNLQSCKIP